MKNLSLKNKLFSLLKLCSATRGTFLLVNCLGLLFLLVGYVFRVWLDYFFLFNLAALTHLVLVTPYNLVCLFGLRLKGMTEKLLGIITTFFFLYCPILLLANVRGYFSLSWKEIFWINIGVFFICFLGLLVRDVFYWFREFRNKKQFIGKNQDKGRQDKILGKQGVTTPCSGYGGPSFSKKLFSSKDKLASGLLGFLGFFRGKSPREGLRDSVLADWGHKIQKLRKRHMVFLIIIVLYGIIHFLNFQFYHFIPEKDGYKYMLDIQATIDEKEVIEIGRSGFLLTNAVLTVYTKISTYDLFSFWYIFLEILVLAIIYRFIKIYKIKDKKQQFLTLLCGLCVPVMSLEFDLIRPQTFFVVFLPGYIYLVYQALKQKKATYWFLASLIALTGFVFHEFLFFLMLVHPLIVFINCVRYLLTKVRKKQISKTKILYAAIVTVGVILILITLLNVFKQNLDLSEILNKRVRAVTDSINDNRQWDWWFIDSYDYGVGDISYPGLVGAAKFYGYFISPVIVMILVFLFYLVIRQGLRQVLKDNLIRLTLVFMVIFFIFAEIIPRLGYLFIPERFWLFFDLGVLIMLVPLGASKFGQLLLNKRNIQILIISVCLIGLAGSFYVTSARDSLTTPKEAEAAEWIKANLEENALFFSQDGNQYMVSYFAERAYAEASREFFMSSKLLKLKPRNRPVYVLYSQEKFNGIFREKDFWKERNCYGADLDKFDQAYDKVYEENGIYIWKAE